MTVQRRQIYTCDFCGMETSYPIASRWFNIMAAKRILGHEEHACKKCGHNIHETLKVLGIEHEFECIEYKDSPEDMGLISVSQ